MNNQEFTKLTNDLFASCVDMMNRKGPDYASGPSASEEERDRLWNFKEVARRSGSDPFKVWAVYFIKHIVSLEKWVRERELQSESLEGRIIDAINYLVLFKALLKEGEGEGMQKEPETFEPIDRSPQNQFEVTVVKAVDDNTFQDKLAKFFKS